MTTTTTAQAQATQIYQLFIRATPEQIWEAIIDPAFTVRYFHGARIEVRDGRRHAWGPDGQLWGDEAVIESDPPRRLVPAGGHGTTLRWRPRKQRRCSRRASRWPRARPARPAQGDDHGRARGATVDEWQPTTSRRC